ncbi:MAG: hypothetical protein COA44_02100 [Arcobacter sp.]|nr:MAG: hypothetical protein COA44_02100 [Arcobacter sp.]
MSIFKKLFSTKKVEGIRLEITKYDVNDMKDSDQKHQDKVDRDLKKTPEVVDRRALMVYEKRFMEKFKKIGNLHQKCPYCAKAYKTLNLGEKKCTQCDKAFMVKKRVQDLGTVAYRLESKKHFDLQWKAVSKIKKFKFYLTHEYEYIEQQLKKQGKMNLQATDIMHSVISAYSKNSLNSGHYELYTAFMFHKAELMRSQQRFAEALEYYFYVHFLQSNGVDNEANFVAKTKMNPELRERLIDLLNLGNIQVKQAKALFDYSIKHLSVFCESRMSVNPHKSYSILMKEFKDEDAAKDVQKPMRSFVLYTKAS